MSNRRLVNNCLLCHGEWWAIKAGDTVTYRSQNRGYEYQACVEAVQDEKSLLGLDRKLTIVFKDGHGTRIRLKYIHYWSAGIVLPHKRTHPFHDHLISLLRPVLK